MMRETARVLSQGTPRVLTHDDAEFLRSLPQIYSNVPLSARAASRRLQRRLQRVDRLLKAGYVSVARAFDQPGSYTLSVFLTEAGVAALRAWEAQR
jgi:hypothetical protein